MFNFLVTGSEKAWDFSAYEFPDLSRFTELTQPEIKAQFTPLDETKITELKKMPALFTYEGENKSAKIGYITRVTPRASSILVEYEFETRIPEFPFLQLRDQHYRMDIRKFEMNRTHWAVKDGDLFEILLAAGVIDEDLFYSLGRLEKIQSRRFKVALSFPGERRGYVSDVVLELKRRLSRGSIFYDRDFTGELAVANLDTLLQKIYLENSDLVVVFLCAEYEEKQWCGLEWRAIREHIKNRRDEQVMFMRFDDAAVQGVFSTDGYVDLRHCKAVEAAELIVRRVKLNELA
jgi:hypothetical protein